MPEIVVIAEPRDGDRPEVTWRERLAPGLLASEHYSAQLLERVRWAAEDAVEIEHRGERIDGRD
jgi:hypothetical protein